MIVGVPVERSQQERRVALVPQVIPALARSKVEVLVEPGAGAEAGFPDSEYQQQGGQMARDYADLCASAEILLRVSLAPANATAAQGRVDSLRPGQCLVGLLNPWAAPNAVRALAEQGVTAFALELLPRISRAQAMDALTSMATIAGYKAALLAANALPKLYPMMITAAGTIMPARVFVIGAGVAGLQAIASSKRLGAVVQAYDVRPAVKEQVESLGAKFVEMPLETEDAEAAGGYARELGEEFYRKQRELMARTVAASDVCITTAAIPGKPSPRLITADAVRGMAPGSVIVDLAAERGGNCELTKADQVVVEYGVTILGPTNLPSEVPTHASQMLAKNLTNFVRLITRDGSFHLNLEDEVVRDTLAAYRGEVVSPQVRALLGLEPLKTPQPGAPPVDHLAAR